MNECDIFIAALDIDSPIQRSAYLDQACGRNRMMRRRLEDLLASHSDAGSLWERAALNIHATPYFESFAERPGAAVGPYTLLEKIGEGGMGVIFRAEQFQPVRRTVALKLIKPGMDSRQVIARFAAEKQALALMDHPNIAKVLDAGTTGGNAKSEARNRKQFQSPQSEIQNLADVDNDVTSIPDSKFELVSEFGFRNSDFITGRPYVVMELVDGVPITEYCDAHRLSIRARLELFVEICQAVQHAHQKGIIHRDLKPSNVLIALCDGRPTPKIIDFGVAKATGPKLTAATLHTEVGQVVGTLEYMSPEQAEQNHRDVDTRSDIYSLGVLLYELLTGTTPLELRRLQQTALVDGLRLVREEEPPRPSSRLTDAEALPTIAANRGLEPKRLSNLVRGELDWIAMKCLEKDRERRYGSAGSLASDVERYLRDEPVLACPPSALYRFGKFARKYRMAIAVACGFAAVLIAAVIVSTSLAVRASRANAQAKANEQRVLAKEREALASAEQARRAADAEQQARQKEAAHRKRAEAISKFLFSAFRYPDAARDVRTITLAEVLARCAEEVQEKLADSPTKAELLVTIAESYGDMGLYREQIPLWEWVRDYLIRTFGADHPTTLAVRGRLAGAFKRTGRLDEARQLLEVLLAQMEDTMGPDDTHTRITMVDLSDTYRKVGKLDKAMPLAHAVFARAMAKLGPDHPETMWAMKNLAKTYVAASRFDDALRLYEENVQRKTEALGPDHPDVIAARQTLADKYARHGRPAEAASEFTRLLRTKPDDHGSALRAALLSLAASDRERYDAVCRQMLDRFAHTDSGWAANRTSLACLMSSSPVGDIQQLVRLADLALSVSENSPNVGERVIHFRTRGLAAYRAGDFHDALEWCQKSRDLDSTSTNASTFPATNLVIEALAWSQLGKPSEAEAAFDESVRMIERHFPDAPANLGVSWFNWFMHELLRREAEELMKINDVAAADQAPVTRTAVISSPTRPEVTDN